jgi:hypothetical protein
MAFDFSTAERPNPRQAHVMLGGEFSAIFYKWEENHG